MDNMEENRKRAGGDDGGKVTGKRARTPATTEESEDEEIAAWLSVDDESVTELAKLLEAEVRSTPVKVRFIDDPYSSALIFQSSSSYVTINGNEESCGSSFSDCECSVMASVDNRGLGIVGGRREFCFAGLSGWFMAAGGGVWCLDGEAARRGAKEEGGEL